MSGRRPTPDSLLSFSYKSLTSLLIFLSLSTGTRWAQAKDFEIVELKRTPEYSVHRVRVWTQEPPHLHATHDSTVFIEQGGGVLYLNGVAHSLSAGDTVEIPRQIPHYFVHGSSASFTQARVIFRPPFDGKDRVLIVNSGWRTRAARFLEKFFMIFTGQWAISNFHSRQ